jgi:hypothetical protein
MNDGIVDLDQVRAGRPDRRVVMRLVRKRVPVVPECAFCHKPGDATLTTAEGERADGRTVLCCKGCLQGGKEEIDRRLRAQIVSLESQRRLLDQVSLPSFDAWLTAERAARETGDPDVNRAAELVSNALAPLAAGLPPGVEGTIILGSYPLDVTLSFSVGGVFRRSAAETELPF